MCSPDHRIARYADRVAQDTGFPAADAGNGVWAIIARDGENARVEQVFPTEIEALRANQHNTDGFFAAVLDRKA